MTNKNAHFEFLFTDNFAYERWIFKDAQNYTFELLIAPDN
jgi:hypothetical protein